MMHRKKKYLEIVKFREHPYRTSQNILVLLIQTNASDETLWSENIKYQENISIYKHNVVALSKLLDKDIANNYKFLLFYIVGLVIAGIFCVELYLNVEIKEIQSKKT